MSFDRTNTWGDFSFETIYDCSFRDANVTVEIPQCWNSKLATMMQPAVDWPDFMGLEEFPDEAFDFFSPFKSYTPSATKPELSDLNKKSTPLSMSWCEMMQKIYYDTGYYAERGVTVSGHFWWWAEPTTINDQIPDRLVFPDTFMEFWPTLSKMDYFSRMLYFAADKARVGRILQGLCDLLEKMIYLVRTTAKLTPLESTRTGYVSPSEHYAASDVAQMYLCKKFQVTAQLPVSERLWPSWSDKPTSNFGSSIWEKEYEPCEYFYIEHRFGDEKTGQTMWRKRDTPPYIGCYELAYANATFGQPPHYFVGTGLSWHPKNTVFLGPSLTNSTAWAWHVDTLYAGWGTAGDTEIHWDYGDPVIPSHLHTTRYYIGKPTEETVELHPSFDMSLKAICPDVRVGRFRGSAYSSMAYCNMPDYQMYRESNMKIRVEGDNADQVKMTLKIYRTSPSTPQTYVPATLYLEDSTQGYEIPAQEGFSYLDFYIDIDATNGYTDCNFIMSYDTSAFGGLWGSGLDSSGMQHIRSCTWDVESNYTPGFFYSAVTKTPYGSGYRLNKCTLYGMRHPALYLDGEPGWWLGTGSNRDFTEDKLYTGVTCKKTGQNRETFTYTLPGSVRPYTKTYDLGVYQLRRSVQPMEIKVDIFCVNTGVNDSITCSVYSWQPILPY